MTLIAAFLGWMFDGFEMGLFPLVGQPALLDLLGPGREAQVNPWMGMMAAVFLIGAATGGVVFGWLGDRIGRVRAMTFSVLTYALFMGLCGLARTPEQMFFLRFLSALGMGGEWSLGVALVMELWPNKTRGLLSGLIGGAANFGFLLIAIIGLGMGRMVNAIAGGLFALGFPEDLVNALVRNSGWRLMMLIGAIPALLTFFIRLCVPESGRWKAEQASGKTSHWATQDLIGILIGSLAALCIIYVWADPLATGRKFSLAEQVSASLLSFVIALGGFIYPVLRFLQRAKQAGEGLPIRETLGRMLLGACLSGVAFIGTWGAVQFAPTWGGNLASEAAQTEGVAKSQLAVISSDARSQTQIIAAIGAILGTMAGALLGNAIGRRPTYVLMCLLSYGLAFLFFRLTSFGSEFLALVFGVGFMSASFYGWLPLYLPELFRTKIRASGQGFGFNFGRILAAVGALQAGNLMAILKGIPHACSYIILVYLFGAVIIWIAPETKGQPLLD